MEQIIPFSAPTFVQNRLRLLAWRKMALLACLVWGLLGFGPAARAADNLPEQAYINGLRGFPQKFTLSCEARSAVDWAAFWGVQIREKKFLLSLPRSDNPERGFVGNPNGPWGNIPPHAYGAHAAPVAETLRAFGIAAQAHRDLSWDDLRAEIVAGRPVIVWVVGQMWPGNPLSYRASDGQVVSVARYEHTMILIGYDPSRVHVIDAYSGQIQSYPRQTFLASWKTLGRMAITGSGLVQSVPEPTPDPVYTVRHYLPLVFGRQTYTEAAPPSPEPQVARYTVKRGDYLVLLARRIGLNWRTLAEINHIPYPYTLYPGQVLRLR